MRRSACDPLSLSRALDQAPTEHIDGTKVGAHSFQHDLPVDVDHVTVPDFVIVHYAGHLRPGGKLARLRLRGEDRHPRKRQIIEDELRHILERTPRMMLQHE